MKARNREINIFNMSLLDILCGALGVFCFMTLVLFPYWRPTGATAETLEKNKQAIEEELKQLKQKLGESVDGKQALQQLEQLEQRMKQQQGDLNQARRELAEKDKKMERLEMRNPLVVAVEWDTAHDADVFLEPVNFGSNGKLTERIDPKKKQGTNFTGEAMADHNKGPATDVWLQRDLVSGGEEKVYYKLIKMNGETKPANLSGYFIANDVLNLLPSVVVAQEQTAVWVGTFKMSADYQVRFEAAPELKEAYRQKVEAWKPSAKKGAGQ
jgi:hypothetical protein